MSNRRHIWSQVVFYLGWIAMIFLETTAWSIVGLIPGLVAFTAGGYLWALWHINNTESEAKIHGPVLVLMDKMFQKTEKTWPLAALLGGGPGVGLVLKKQASPSARKLSFLASAFYAIVWCLIHWLRPDAGVPVRTWPSLDFLKNLKHII